AAVMAVGAPHMCGVGGGKFAMGAGPDVRPAPLNATRRAGAGADAARLRGPGAGGVAVQRGGGSGTGPGWGGGRAALRERVGSLGLGELLAPARRLATEGFPVSATLARASAELDPRARRAAFGDPAPLAVGRRLLLPGVGRALEAIAASG